MWNRQSGWPERLLEFHLYSRHFVHPPGKTNRVCLPGWHPPFPRRSGDRRQGWGNGKAQGLVRLILSLEGMPGWPQGSQCLFPGKECPEPLGTQTHCVPDVFTPLSLPLFPPNLLLLPVPHLSRWPSTCPGGRPKQFPHGGPCTPAAAVPAN